MALTPTDPRIKKGAPDECWLWTGARNGPGYGYAHVNGRTMRVCRLILSRAIGRDLRTDEYALHRCDNPPCCNPAHLFVGSAADNARDMSRKGRSLTGGKNGNLRNAKLSQDEVIAIRADSRTEAAVAADYGVSTTQIGRIRRGERWAWI